MKIVQGRLQEQQRRQESHLNPVIPIASNVVEESSNLLEGRNLEAKAVRKLEKKGRRQKKKEVH